MTVTASYFIAVGLMVVPVKSYTAARPARLSLVNVHEPCARDGKDAKLQSGGKICSACAAKVGDDSVVKGYPSGQGTYVLLRPEELAELKPEKDKAMTVKAFVPAAEIDAVFLGASDHLGPVDGAAVKAFQLLRISMATTQHVAIVQYGTKVGVVRPLGEGLMLHDMFLETEVRSFAERNKVEMRPVEFTKQEVELGQKLIDAYAAPFDITQYKDTFMDRAHELIQARLAGQPAPKRAVEVEPVATGPDLAATLMASLAAAAKGRKLVAVPGKAPAKPKAAKRKAA